MRADLLVVNIGELLTLAGPPVPRRGADMRELSPVRSGAVAAHDGRIVAVGEQDAVLSEVDADGACVVDAGGAVVSPGLVDPHTHAVFAATRENEFQELQSRFGS